MPFRKPVKIKTSKSKPKAIKKAIEPLESDSMAFANSKIECYLINGWA